MASNHGNPLPSAGLLRLAMLLSVLAAGVPPASGQGQVTLTVGQAEGPPGKTVEVKVSLSDATGLGSMDLLLRYDARVLRFESASIDGPSGASLVANSPRQGQAQVAVLCGGGLAQQELTFTLRFAVLAPAGEHSRIDVVRASAYKAETALAMPLRFEGGQVRVAAASPGDAPAPVSPRDDSSGAVPGDRPARVAPSGRSGDPTGTTGPDAAGAGGTTTPASRDSAGGWELDVSTIVNLTIATSAGLMVLVLLIGLAATLRGRAATRRRGEPAGQSQPRARYVEDLGPIPLEGSRLAPPAGGPADTPPRSTPATPSCPGCRRPLPLIDARFCPHCGQKLV